MFGHSLHIIMDKLTNSVFKSTDKKGGDISILILSKFIVKIVALSIASLILLIVWNNVLLPELGLHTLSFKNSFFTIMLLNYLKSFRISNISFTESLRLEEIVKSQLNIK